MGACLWPGNNELMKRYHDYEWCVPSHDDEYIFEMLTLEGAQAGLSWKTVLAKREEYQNAFHHFDIAYCSTLAEEELETIGERYNVIKNRSKLRSVRSNALAVLNIRKESGSFADYLWNFVGGNPVINSWESEGQIPAQTSLSEQISKDLKKRGFKFVGPVIIYSFLQAIGMVDDHLRSCPYHSQNR